MSRNWVTPSASCVPHGAAHHGAVRLHDLGQARHELHGLAGGFPVDLEVVGPAQVVVVDSGHARHRDVDAGRSPGGTLHRLTPTVATVGSALAMFMAGVRAEATDRPAGGRGETEKAIRSWSQTGGTCTCPGGRRAGTQAAGPPLPRGVGGGGPARPSRVWGTLLGRSDQLSVGRDGVPAAAHALPVGVAGLLVAGEGVQRPAVDGLLLDPVGAVEGDEAPVRPDPFNSTPSVSFLSTARPRATSPGTRRCRPPSWARRSPS